MTRTSLIRFLNALYKNCKNEKYKIEYRKKLSLPYYLDQVLIGLLLSDGSLEKTSPTSVARLSVMFGNMHISYLLHLYNLFEPYINSDIRTINVYNKKTNIIYTQVGFKTISLPVLLLYHKLFYKTESKRYIKIVPINIEEFLTPVVLAHLIMGDGNLKKTDNIIRIYTNSFIKKDVERLSLAITKKLGIIVKVVHDRNDQYIITISKNQLELVRSLISPYMHQSMVYKLGLEPNQGQFFKLKDHLYEI